MSFQQKLNNKLVFDLFIYQLKVNYKPKVVRILSNYPDFASLKDKFHRYPIHYAASRNMGKMAKILMSFDSPLYLPDGQGRGALDYAYANCNFKILKVR